MGMFKKTMSILVLVFFVLSLTAASASAGSWNDRYDWKDRCDWKGKCGCRDRCDFGFGSFFFGSSWSFFGCGGDWFGDNWFGDNSFGDNSFGW